MKEKISTKGVISKGLLRLTACGLLILATSQQDLWAYSGKPGSAIIDDYQQQKTISGKVVDQDGYGLPGVNILIKGTTQGTITQVNGEYSLQASPGDILVFSYLGFTTQEIVVGNNPTVNVTMEENIKAFEEVVVIGYGTQKKGDVTSAVGTVKKENFTQGLVRDASDLIKGKVAGLSISNGSGDPSAQATINLRGVSSLFGNSTPLILINGISGGLNTVAPEDIESIDVLKDASAAAIYGTRGAAGVIIITTKSGKYNAKSEVTYSTYYAASIFGKKADFLTASEYRQKKDEGITTLAYNDEGASTDWLKEITRTGFTQNHNVSMRGGYDNTNYSANIDYIDQKGVFNGTRDNNLKVTFDVNQYLLNKKVKINLNIVKGIDKVNAVGDASSFNESIYRQALIRNPTAPIKKADGTWVEDGARFQYYNPVAMIEETDGEFKSEYTRLTSNITFIPIKDWETNVMISQRSDNKMSGYYETKQNYSNTVLAKNGVASKNASTGHTNQMEITSKYSKSIGKNRFSALGGYSYEYNVGEDLSAFNYNFPSDAFSYNNLGSGYALAKGKATMGSYKSDNTLVGFFGRATYSFDDKYSVLASMRHEGSSKFGANYKWGNFPSVSLGWNINKESFMQSFSWINNLKLRAGFGITGVIPSNPYQSLTRLNYEKPFFSNGQWIKGLVPVRNPNPDLKWEKSREYNIGIDYSFLANRINGSIDVYSKLTTDMLWEYSVPKPPALYNETLANVGEMTNKGIEVLINAEVIRTTNFDWTSTLTISHNENELLSLSNEFYSIEGNSINIGDCGDPISMPTHRLEKGRSIGNFWGLKSVDITNDGQWIIETPKGERVTLDKTLYGDSNKQYLGNGIPKFTGGWTNTLRYKRIDMSMVFSYALGFQILNFQRMFYENPNIKYNNLKNAFDKVYGKSILNYEQTFVSYYIEDGDYVKLDNVTLGYTFPKLKSNLIQKIRLYASGQNLLCFTGYKGLDPEIARYDPLTQGDDSRDKYPTTRTFTIGLNVTF